MPRIDCFDIIKNNPELVSEFISITEDMPEVEQRKQAIQIVNKLLEASNESLNKVKRKVGQKPQKYNSGVSQDAIDEIIKKYSQPEQKETPQAERDVESKKVPVLSKDEKKVLKDFLMFVETRQSERRYQNMNVEGFKNAYNNLPQYVKDFISSDLKGKLRAYEGDLNDSEIPSFSNQFIPQLFGNSKVRGEQVEAHSGAIDTKRLVELADNNNIKHGVGDSEGEVIVITPKFKNGTDSNRGALYDYKKALIEMDSLLGDDIELNKNIRKEKRRLDELLDERKFYNDLANSDNVFDVLKKYDVDQKYFKQLLPTPQAVESLLSKEQTPAKEEAPASKEQIESTTKALEGLNNKTPQEIIDASKKIDKVEYVEENEAREIIESYTHYKSGNSKSPATRWAGWFQSVNAENKKFIVEDIQNDPKLRNAMLSLFFDVYKSELNFKGSFNDFLNTEITLYRGVTLADKKGVGQEGFSAFSTTKNRVSAYADEQAIGKGQVKEIKIKPIDTYGAVNYIGGGEVEVLVPTEFKKETIRQDFNRLLELNIGLFSEEQIRLLEEYHDKEDYISGLAFVKSVISFKPKKLSEAYHKAKKDGSNPELVKAVESLLSKEQTPAKEVAPASKEQIESTAKALDGKMPIKKETELPTSILFDLAEMNIPDIGSEEYNKLKKDIETNGIKTPIKITHFLGDNKYAVTDGNHRLIIAKELGIKNAPIEIIESNADSKAAFPYAEYPDIYPSAKNPSKTTTEISEAYHAAKAKPEPTRSEQEQELVKAVESLLSKEQTPQAGSGDVGGEQPLKETSNEGKVNLSTSAPKQSITKKAFTALTTMLKKAFPKVEFIGEKEAREIMGGSDKPSYQITMPDGSKKEVQPINDDVINGFYSPLEKIISETKFDKLPAKQWIDKFAKGEEAKWTGLTDWLNQQQGSVSKADIQQYLKDNRIEVVEVVKGEVLDKKQLDPRKNSEDNWDIYYKGEKIFVLDNYQAKDRDEAIEVVLDADVDWKGGTTKFSQYQIEGQKENYKEVLVTMPKKKVKVDGFEISETDTVIYEDRGMGKPLKVIKVIPKKFTEASSEANKYISDNSYKHEYNLDYNDGESVIDALKKGGVKIDETNFESSHYDEPNILVHLRMNTRTDADGNKVLFLEEIQSDWGQTGKKEGFENPAYSVKLSDKEIDGLKLYDILMDGKPLADIDTRDLAKWYENKYREKLYPRNASENQANKVAERLNEALTEGKVPSAPFVTDTNAWTKLGLKVALKEAVNQRATKIAWTTGEQQNDRYDLSKTASEVDFTWDNDRQLGVLTVFGLGVDNTILEEVDVPLNKVQDYIGKEPADRIAEQINSQTGKYRRAKLDGEGLKVGGKGMKGFYGSPKEGGLGIVGNVAKSLTKQEVGTVEIENGSNRQAKYIGESPTLEDLEKVKAVAIKGGSDIYISPITGDKQMFPVNRTANSTPLVNAIREVRNGKDVITAMKENGVDPELFGGKWEEQSKSSTQHSIDITPELKAQVEQGLPLFMRTAKGEVFGFQQGSKIFIDPSLINADTPIHEVVGHYGMNIIDAMAKGGDEKAQAIIAKGFSLLQAPEGKAVLDEIKANPAYSNLSLREKKMEALATIIGREGANMFAEGTRKNTFASKVKDFIKSFYDYIRTKVPTLKDKTIKQIVAMDNKEFIRAIVGDAFRGEIVQQNNESLSDDKVMLQAQKEADSITLKYNGKGQHLAPNGKPSNLTEQQAKIVRTEAFKNWFGDWENDPKNASKVVDANGEPLVVYHGSKKFGFNEFLEKQGAKAKSKMQLLFGMHFASSKDDAMIYAKKGGIYDLFLNIKTPIDLSKGFIEKGNPLFDSYLKLSQELNLSKDFKNNLDYQLFTKEGDDGGKSNDIQRIFITQFMLDKYAPSKVYSALKNSGFDGVIYEPYQPQGFNTISKFSRSYISFSPNQIKLADGTNTTFNPNTNDIRFQIIGEIGASRLDNAEMILNDLNVAKQMESAGKTPKEIHLATSWEKGADKKWRFELPDIKSIDKLIFNNVKKGEKVTLYELVGDNVIFKAYPELKDLKVKIGKESSFNAIDKTITLSELFTHLSAKSTLIHEMQHAVQDIEGFAYGTTGYREMMSARYYYNESITQKLLKENKEYRDLYIKADNLPYYVSDTSLEINKEREELDNRLQVIFDDYIKKNPIDENKIKEIAKKLYYGNAGEVEARNAQRRMNMTIKERKAKMLLETEGIERNQRNVILDAINGIANSDSNDIRFQASPKTDLQEAERKLKEAWGKYLSNGISFDGMAEAEKERQLIVALLGYLKAKGIDIAKGIGNEVRDFIKNKFSGVTDEMIDVAQGRMLTDYQKLYDTHMTPKNKEILDGMVSQVKSGEMSFEDFINTIDGIVPNERIKNVFISYVNEQIDPLDGYVAVDEEIEESPESPKAETSKEEERAFIGGLLARPINRKNFPNIVGDNKTDDDVLKRITAVTQEDVQDRKVMVDTSYVRVALENIKEIALQNANALYMQFGEDWQNKVMDYLSDYLNAANPAQAIGILNVISTDVQQKIEKSQSPTERTKLFKLQDKADELSILFASQASLGINARKILRQFAQGGNMSKLVLDKILTEDTMQTIEEINRIAASKPTNEELNNATLPVQAPQTPKSRIQKIKQNVKAALSSKQKNKPKITEKEINELGRRAEEERKRQGVQTKMSRQQIAQMLKEEAKKC